MIKRIYPYLNSCWRKHLPNEKDNIINPYEIINKGDSVEVRSVYPSSQEAYDSFNNLVGYCLSQGMKEGDYSTKSLLKEMTPYIENIRLTITKQ